MTARLLLFTLGVIAGCCAVAAVVRVVIAMGSGSEHRRAAVKESEYGR